MIKTLPGSLDKMIHVDHWDEIRISSIIEQQKLLIEKFQKTGDVKLVSEFKILSEEFQRIHKKHQAKISS